MFRVRGESDLQNISCICHKNRMFFSSVWLQGHEQRTKFGHNVEESHPHDLTNLFLTFIHLRRLAVDQSQAQVDSAGSCKHCKRQSTQLASRPIDPSSSWNSILILLISTPYLGKPPTLVGSWFCKVSFLVRWSVLSMEWRMTLKRAKNGEYHGVK